MAHTFLGKTPPHSELSHKKSVRRSTIASLFAASLLLVAIGTSGLGTARSSQNMSTQSVAIAADQPGVRILGDTQPTGQSTANEQKCTVAVGSDTLFPIIPASLKDGGSCPPPQWNLTVFGYFSEKALRFANWFAIALAMVLTVYAGVLYISGFANEGNVKTAKTYLVSTYVGLIIVILARLILVTTVRTLTGNQNADPEHDTPVTNFIK